MKKIELFICFLVLSLALLILLPFNPHSSLDSKVSNYLRDFSKQSLLIPVTKPTRIISLSPSSTEIIYAIGAQNQLIGVTNVCDYPLAATFLPKIGSFEKPDLETIISFKPDLVIAGGNIHQPLIKALKKLNINVVSIDPHSLQDILTSIDIIGTLTHEKVKSTALIAKLKNSIPNNSRTLLNNTPTVFLEIWDNPLISVGNNSYINDILRQAGTINVMNSKKSAYVLCDLEMLYTYNPDIYLILKHDKYSRSSLRKPSFLEDITAFREQRIYYISEDYLARPGPRSFQALTELTAIIEKDQKVYR